MFRRRLGILTILFLAVTVAVFARLVSVQVVDPERFRSGAAERVPPPAVVPAVRGAILDRDGRPLARDRCAWTIDLVPSRLRERALVHAVVDARVLLDASALAPEAAGEGWVRGRTTSDLHWAVITRPLAECRRLLALPAVALDVDAGLLASRGRALADAVGGLLRGPEEMEPRLRQALAVLTGRPGSWRRSELSRAARAGADLGSALGLDARDLAARVEAECALLDEVGRQAGCPDPPETWRRIGALLARERTWVSAQIERELRDLVLLDVLGTPEPSPVTLGAGAFAGLVRTLRLPWPDEELAAAAIAAADRILGGSLPVPVADHAPASSSPPPASSPALKDPVGFALAAGLYDDDPERVRDAWWESFRKSPAFDRAAHLDARRERELRAAFRGTRAFLFGRRAEVEIAGSVLGPGGLGDLGFSLVPSFTRDEEVDENLSPSLRLLVGDLTGDLRTPRRPQTLEARLDGHLRGGAGAAPEAGGVEAGAGAVRHGLTAATTLSLPLQRRVEDCLRAAHPVVPAAVAVVDPRDGAVLALATWPVPGDVDRALRDREALEHEKLVLRRRLARGEGWAEQRLALLLRSGEIDGGEENEREILVSARSRTESELEACVREIGEALALHPAYHRAVDIPEASPPGSVFKAVTILAGLESGAIQPASEFQCVHDPARDYHNCKGHGSAIGVRLALKKSCNAFCYETGVRVGNPRLVEFLDVFGFFDEIPGLLPADPGLRETLLEDDQPKNLAIGGGSLRCAPVRAAGVAASLGRGLLVRPHLLAPEGFVAVGPAIGRPEHVALVREGMREVVRPGGTAGGGRGAGLDALRVAAKTGTADYTSPGGYQLNQSWFVGFAPADPGEAPQIAFAVVLLHTPNEIEGADAAPLSLDVIEAFGEVFPARRWW